MDTLISSTISIALGGFGTALGLIAGIMIGMAVVGRLEFPVDLSRGKRIGLGFAGFFFLIVMLAVVFYVFLQLQPIQGVQSQIETNTSEILRVEKTVSDNRTNANDSVVNLSNRLDSHDGQFEEINEDAEDFRSETNDKFEAQQETIDAHYVEIQRILASIETTGMEDVTVLLEVDRAFELAGTNLLPTITMDLSIGWIGNALDEMNRFLDIVKGDYRNIEGTNWYAVAPRVTKREEHSTAYQDVWDVNLEYHFFITADLSCENPLTGQSKAFISEEVRIVNSRLYLTIIHDRVGDTWRIRELRPINLIQKGQVCTDLLTKPD